MLSSLAHFLAAHALALFMLSVGLRTDRYVLREMIRRWPLVVRVLAFVWLAVPLLAVLVIYTIRPDPFAAVVLAVMAICPGVPLVVRKVKVTRGSQDTSVMLLLATAISALVMIPLWAAVLGFSTNLQIAITPSDIAIVLLPLMLVPFAIGRLVVVVAPRFAPPLARIANALFVAGIVLIVVAVFGRLLSGLRELGVRDLVAALVFPAGAAALGYVAAAGTTRPADRVAVVFSVAMGNPALALATLEHTHNAQRANAIPVVLAFIVLRALALLPVSRWLKLKR